MMLDQLVYVVPVCICSVVTGSLLVLFRSEVRRSLRNFLCSLIVHSCIGLEIVKDLMHRKTNSVEAVSWPGGVAVVTGARGIGFEVIKKLLESDMTVIIGCRDVSVGQTTVSRIRDSGVSKGSTRVNRLDLTSMTSIKTFADDVLQQHHQLHLLVNNAGVSLKSHSLTGDGVEKTLSTNYLGHCYLTHLLLPVMARATGGQARVVNVASVSHRFPLLGRVHFEDLNLRDNYEEYTAYSQSKLCQVMFTTSLNAKLRRDHIPVCVFAVHPGIVHSGIVSNSIAHRLGGCLFPLILRTPEEGARAVYYACVSPELQSRGGAYVYSCVETPTGKCAQSEESQAKLWRVTMDLLGLKTFGNVTT